jgi:hypothetical protein
MTQRAIACYPPAHPRAISTPTPESLTPPPRQLHLAGESEMAFEIPIPTHWAA